METPATQTLITPPADDADEDFCFIVHGTSIRMYRIPDAEGDYWVWRDEADEDQFGTAYSASDAVYWATQYALHKFRGY